METSFLLPEIMFHVAITRHLDVWLLVPWERIHWVYVNYEHKYGGALLVCHRPIVSVILNKIWESEQPQFKKKKKKWWDGME